MNKDFDPIILAIVAAGSAMILFWMAHLAELTRHMVGY